MTNCLAVVVGNFDPVEDKPLKELVTGLLDKKGTGCSLTASKTTGYIAKGLLCGWAMNGERDHNGAGGKTKLRLGATD